MSAPSKRVGNCGDFKSIHIAGAYQAMKTGYVDEEWAKEHHEYWYKQMKQKSPSPAAGGALRVAAPQA